MTDSTASPLQPYIDSDQTAVSRTGAFQAVVDAGEVETEYVRAGSGQVVLYLRGGPVDPEEDELFVALAERFRVIVPQSTSLGATIAPAGSGDSAFTHWLDGFLEGLGILQASLVVEEPLGAEALRFAMARPALVARLVILAPDASPEPRRLTTPTLVLRSGDDAAISETLRFLTHD
jgi:pimeloyl-ACP methyl ester carboxylesterase